MTRSLIYYVFRRVAALVALLILVSFGVFSLLYLAPGNPVDILLGDTRHTPETARLIGAQYHLDDPFLTQYWIWVKGAVHLDFGNSISTLLPVTDGIRNRLPLTLFLGGYAFILTMFFGITLGALAALKRRGTVDRVVTAGAIVGLSTPVFVSGVLLLYLFAVVLPWFPSYGRGSGFVDELWHLTLPAVALAIGTAAYLVRHTRAAMSSVLDQDYVTFARARGLSRPRILFGYALRNALIPVVTITAIVITSLIVGTVLVEVTFALSGIGGLLVQSAQNKDIPMLQGTALFIAFLIIVVNLLADVVYALVDPRIRLGSRPS